MLMQQLKDSRKNVENIEEKMQVLSSETKEKSEKISKEKSNAEGEVKKLEALLQTEKNANREKEYRISELEGQISQQA